MENILGMKVTQASRKRPQKCPELFFQKEVLIFFPLPDFRLKISQNKIEKEVVFVDLGTELVDLFVGEKSKLNNILVSEPQSPHELECIILKLSFVLGLNYFQNYELSAEFMLENKNLLVIRVVVLAL